REYRARRRLDDRVDRVRGRREHVYLAVPVRADTEPADGRHLDRDRAQFQPGSFRHLAWHNGCGWLCARAAGSRRAAAVCGSIHCKRAGARKLPGGGLDPLRRLLYGVASIAIVLPPESFQGAVLINAAGITAAVILLALDWFRRKQAKPSEAPATPY